MNLTEITIRREEVEEQRNEIVKRIQTLVGEVKQEHELIEMIEEVFGEFAECKLIIEENEEIYIAFDRSLYSQSEQEDLKHTICHLLIERDNPLYRTKVLKAVIDMSTVQERKSVIKNEIKKLNGTKETEEELREILRKGCQKNRCKFNAWDYEYDRIYLEEDEINYIASIDYRYSDNGDESDDESEEVQIIEVICS